ncbi:uncharacterized protein LOC124166962 [Ischnura elegans]|uniref:uncharacterized protein LOC124166962 n=1 Tax=Ischnura elegans TaxID=197161 RepID=UPI001ED878C2|nr:uncharacterized protein LOC124166962 [Ischnura elegans]
MTFISKPSGNGGNCCGTQNKTSQRDCNEYQRPPSRKKSDCQENRAPSFRGCIQLDVDKCKLSSKSKSKICGSHGLEGKRSPNGSSTGLCGSQPTFKPKQSYCMPSSCCASHAPRVKKSPSGSSSKYNCVTRKSSKQSIRGKSNSKTRDNWSDCRNLPTKKMSGDKKFGVNPSEGQIKDDDWWCDCRHEMKISGKKKLCIRPGPIYPKGNIRVPDTVLESATTYKTDYIGKYGPPREAIRPSGSMKKKCGPISSLTTTKVDYTPKPHSKRDPIYPPRNSLGAGGPMEGETTTMHDYQVPRGFIPAKSFRPVQACRTNLDPMEDETTHKADYVNWNTRGPQGPFPWTPGNKFTHPTIPMVGDTTYKTDYTNNGMGDRRTPILPKGNNLMAGNRFIGCTTYKHDYVPWECINENDQNATQGFNDCFRMAGETREDQDKNLWCYKSEDVCPSYPPNFNEGAIPGTTQNNYASAKPEARDSYHHAAANPCGYSKQETTQNYNADVCATTNYGIPPKYSCGHANHDYSINQQCRPTKEVTHDYKQETNKVCQNNDYNNSAHQTCGPQKCDTKTYNYNEEEIRPTYNNNYTNQTCGPDNHNYTFNKPCRPSNEEKIDYNKNFNEVCGSKGIHQPCGSAKDSTPRSDQTCGYTARDPKGCGSQKTETKQYDFHVSEICAKRNYNETCGQDNHDCTFNKPKDSAHRSDQTCGYTAHKPKSYAPFDECCNNKQKAKAPPGASQGDPCCGTANQYTVKETSENPSSKPYYSVGQKYDQNCACMSQPTSRFTTQEERVLTVHC